MWMHLHMLAGLFVLATSTMTPDTLVIRWMCGLSIEVLMAMYEYRRHTRRYDEAQIICVTAASIFALGTCSLFHKYLTS